MVNTVKNLLMMLKYLQKRHLKFLQKEYSKITEATGDFIGNKTADRIRKFKIKIHTKIIQRQLHMRRMK